MGDSRPTAPQWPPAARGFAGVLLALPMSAMLSGVVWHLRATYLESPLYGEP